MSYAYVPHDEIRWSATLRQTAELAFIFKAVLKSKLTTFWHISEGTFYRKHVKFVGTLFLLYKID